jgi:O-antigen/teichoic acid export membrane protein
MFVTSAMLIVISQADLWIVAKFLPTEQVAIYGAAVRLVQLVMVPMLVVNAVLPPFVASLYREGRLAELEGVVRLAAAAGFLPALCIWLVFSLAGVPILELLYGPHYRAGATTLALVSAGQVLNGLAGGSAVVLMMTGHQFSLMCISIVCSALLVAGSLALVETYGMVGIATATGVSVALHGLLCLLWVKQKTGIWTCFGGLRSIRRVVLNVQQMKGV